MSHVSGDRERKLAAAALADEVAKLRAMGDGSGRNKALNDAAHSLGTMNGWIDLNEVAAALFEASVANGYVAKDGEVATKQTIGSGLMAGQSKPRQTLALPAHMRLVFPMSASPSVTRRRSTAFRRYTQLGDTLQPPSQVPLRSALQCWAG